jgi:hypothetical protein
MIKQIVLLYICISSTGVICAQNATNIYKKAVNSTVTIATDNGQIGSGFFVKDNIIATNYHVIEGATIAYCYLNNYTVRYEIEGYVAVDPDIDLVLLVVAGAKRPSIKFARSDIKPGEKVYAIGSPIGLPATISDGIVSGLRQSGGYNLIQITAPISSGSSGGPVLNASGELIGISWAQYSTGQNLNFVIPKAYLEVLLRNREPYSIPIETLYTPTPERTEQNEANYYGKDRIWDIGIVKRSTPGFSLDYFINTGEHSIFLFTYRHESQTQPYQTIWLENYRLADLETGKVYYATRSDMPDKNHPRVIYNGNETKFTVIFDRLPGNLRRFSLIENDCSGNAFCFLNVNLNDYREVEGFDYEQYVNTSEEGTVTFYTNYGKGAEVRIYIEGYYVGSLSKFFENRRYVPQCGDDGTLTIRLNTGTYNYTATDGKGQWSGKITIPLNGCAKQCLAGQ